MRRELSWAVWLVLAAAGCSRAPQGVHLAEPLGPEQEKAAIKALREAWTRGEGKVREQPPASAAGPG